MKFKMSKALKRVGPPRWLAVGSVGLVALVFLILAILATGFKSMKKPVEKFEGGCAGAAACGLPPSA